MATKLRSPRVLIEPEHKQRFIELANLGVGASASCRIIQKEFKLPALHTREADRQMLLRLKNSRAKESSTMTKRKVDPEEMNKLLLAGKNNHEIGDILGISFKAVTHWRQKLQDKGLLPPSIGGRPKGGKMTTRVEATTHKPRHDKTKTLAELSVDQIDEIGTLMYERAIKYPILEKEIWGLKNILAARDNEILMMKEDAKKKQDREGRIRLAKQQGRMYGD